MMIHNANEYVAKHHRYLLSGVAIGLKSLDGKSSTPESGDKGIPPAYPTPFLTPFPFSCPSVM